MAFARDSYTATGGQTDFTITFPYLDEDHVVVTQNGTTLTVTTDYTFPDASTIRFVTGATANDVVVLTRSTSQTARLVDYTAGPLVEADLDNDSLQAFYMVQEGIDQANIALALDNTENWDALSALIKNVLDPVSDQDAATKAYVDTAVATAVLGSLSSPLSLANGGTAATSDTAARVSLGVEIGVDVQAYDAGLADIAALAVTDGNFIVGDGANWVAETPATALTSLGLTTASRIKTAQRLSLYNLAV